jgi:hypothetical protein
LLALRFAEKRSQIVSNLLAQLRMGLVECADDGVEGGPRTECG